MPPAQEANPAPPADAGDGGGFDDDDSGGDDGGPGCFDGGFDGE